MTTTRRRYDSPVRRRRMEETRERIVEAGTELVHGFPDWDWRELTFRAVGERAGVSERTVYRYFPTERRLHDAVLQRLEEQAGVDYEAVDRGNLADVARRIYSSLPSYAAHDRQLDQADPTLEAAEDRRRAALRRAAAGAAPQWSEDEREMLAALLDVVWSVPSYERLVRLWGLDEDVATEAIPWLLRLVLRAAEEEDPPRPQERGSS